jgi:rhodanese-related sulfurtransferase
MRRFLAESSWAVAQLVEFIGNHPLLVGVFAILLALFIRNEMQRGGRSLSPQELVNLVNRENAVVVDLRDPKEYEAGHIAGAINIPHPALDKRITELSKHKAKPIALVCRMGQNSGAAGTVLRKHGFENVTRLRGGMIEWRNQSLPVVKG